MMWVSVILAVLKGVNMMLEYGQQQKWISEGQAIEIAKASAEILRKSNYAKQALAEFTSKSESDVDDFLRGLGQDPDSK